MAGKGLQYLAPKSSEIIFFGVLFEGFDLHTLFEGRGGMVGAGINTDELYHPAWHAPGLSPLV